jgi:hypothetical protein
LKLKNTAAVLLAFVMVLSLFAVAPASADTVDFDGNGTPDSPLQIGTAEQLLEFGKRVTDGDTDLCAELTADITINEWTITDSDETEYSSIGKYGKKMSYGSEVADTSVDSPSSYDGVFDGNGCTLTLVKEEGSDTYGENIESNRMALFHTIGTDGVVKNLNLDITFTGGAYIAGVAGRNYGTIENVIVDGTITATTSSSFAGGIVASNGCVVEDGVVISAGKILNCLNKADVTAKTYVGGIAGDFLGEMSRCGNVGTIEGTVYFGGLLSMGRNVNPTSLSVPVEKRFIVVDCYNAGEVISAHNYSTADYAGLFGANTVTANMGNWRDSYSGEYADFQIGNVFSYGSVSHTSFPDDEKVIIAGLATAQSVQNFTPYDITQIFSNTYYLEGIGTRLFIPTNLIGYNGLGSALVQTVIHSRTADEFASAELADALNAGREYADAPWEYITGNDYPTLKFERADYDPELDVEPPPEIVGRIDYDDDEQPRPSVSGGGGGGGGTPEATPTPTPSAVPDATAESADAITAETIGEVYSDVRETSWYAPDVAFVTAQGLMKGKGDTGTFAPEDATTRAEWVTILARLEDAPAANENSSPWYQAVLDWATAEGLTDGANPTASITREQLVTILWRLNGSPASNADADLNGVSDWAREAVAWAVERGILQGDANGLRPGDDVKRSEVAAILRRYLEG